MTEIALPKPDWFRILVEDCKRILVSKLVEAKYELGRRISRDSSYERYSRLGPSQDDLARELKVGQQAVGEWIRFYERVRDEFTDNISKCLQEIGDLSWFEIVHEWLPTHRVLPENRPLLPLPFKKYRTVIVDPPWPVQKIIREVRPNQVARLDYDRLSMEAIRNFPIARVIAEDGCHVYLWTTHHFLPDAFDIFEAWNVNYECLLTWVKNVGFTPYSWMYSTEHCLFGRVGDLEVLKRGTRLDFTGQVREHSRKPEEFYDLVSKMSPGPRIDVFSREKHAGFDQYGFEIEKFVISN
jgi:N6-adenosine-specific RNA methylase IME4